MRVPLMALSTLLGATLLTSPVIHAGDYQGGNETPQPARESNTHYPGLGMSQGTLDSTLFNQLDQNQDGTLSGEELDAYGEPAAGKKDEEKLRLLDRYDTNDNGKISREEFDEGRE
ncbi:hypothetical protein RE428_13410 [Marinobacter nanhaiticus D15-8W]|nr:EF-hand domain-containing protein [Marinobacter nanhaiticus]BES70323.1 hypothetical protein RE428_13410 [Marinobacter nanhaiticus D15-8W]